VEIALLFDLDEVYERLKKGEPSARMPLDGIKARVVLLQGEYSFPESSRLPLQFC
jgi:hypothetical protein